MIPLGNRLPGRNKRALLEVFLELRMREDEIGRGPFSQALRVDAKGIPLPWHEMAP